MSAAALAMVGPVPQFRLASRPSSHPHLASISELGGGPAQRRA